MNPFYEAVVKAALRSLMLVVGGYVGVTANDSQIAEVASAVMVIGGFVWSLFDKYRAEQKRLTAQASHLPMTTSEVNIAVKDGLAPSVLTAPNVVPSLSR